MTRPVPEDGYPYAVTVRDSSILFGPAQVQHTRFAHKQSANLFASLMTGEPNIITRWVLNEATGEYMEVSAFLL